LETAANRFLGRRTDLVDLTIVWLGLFVVFTGSSSIFYLYLRKSFRNPWNLRIDKDFEPSVTILVPAHNEEDAIKNKLQNIKDVLYPKTKMEIIVADDGSTDNTLARVREFTEENQELQVKIVKSDKRLGKARILNKALEQAKNEIIIVSDADSFWPSDILAKSLHYLSDPAVGAITGLGVLNNASQSWITKAETNYLGMTSLIRVGESKISSTIRFEGGFCAYKKEAFEKFDDESGSDDSGTALEIVQHNFRTIAIPETIFYTAFPTRLAERVKVKARRANHLVRLWIKCFSLLLKKRLLLPKRIAVGEILLFIFDPIIFLFLLATSFAIVFTSPLSLFSLFLIVGVAGLLVFVRSYFIEVVLDNLILIYALFSSFLGKRYISWEKSK
jgi:cellulose synthase/poly-beta-1,6-N-acetylglucosamine synthase-like glycosyltransferase